MSLQKDQNSNDSLNNTQQNTDYGSILSNGFKRKKFEPQNNSSSKETISTTEDKVVTTPPKPAIRHRQKHNAAASYSNHRSELSNKTTNEPQVQHQIPVSETMKSKFDAVQQELVEFNRNNNKTKAYAEQSINNQAPAAFLEQNMIANCEPKSKLDKGNQLLNLANDRHSISVDGSNDHHTEGELTTSKNGIADTLDQQRPYPKKVLFIVANEFCERFSYYGLRTVLVLYFRSVLGFSDSNSTVSFHLFASLCYLTPVLGAILGDSVLGKFKTILYLSLVYLIGETVLVISSIYWNSGSLSVFLTFFGLFMIGVGTGGIKPCVSALGGDQFLPHEHERRQAFFSLFYGAINLGSLISMFFVPMLRSDFQCVNRADCFPYAFGLPCILMFVSIVVFLMAKNSYNLVPLPEQNVIVAFCQCTWLALKRKFTLCGGNKLAVAKSNNAQNHGMVFNDQNSTNNSSESVNTPNSSLTNGEGPIFKSAKSNLSNSELKLLDTASPSKNQQQIIETENNQNHWLYLASDRFDSNSIEDFRCVLGILLLFLPLPMYWCLFDQQGSLWTLQASRMDGRLFNTGFVLEPDQMSVANPLLLLAFIPVFEILVYPSLNRCKLMRGSIQRMTVGGLLAALTFVVSALIEIRIQEYQPPLTLATGQAHLLLVNGLTDCTITNSTISTLTSINNPYSNSVDSNITSYGMDNHISKLNETIINRFDSLDSLKAKSIDFTLDSFPTEQSPDHHLKFKLTSANHNQLNLSGCPFDPKIEHSFGLGGIPDKSVKLLYIEQGNGKITYKVFDESLELPAPGKARVRLLYESFGSLAAAEKRSFYLVSSSDNDKLNLNSTSSSIHIHFPPKSKSGQVFLSAYIDVDVPSKGGSFRIKTNDNLLNNKNFSSSNTLLNLAPATRNLIVVHQKDATNVIIKHELLQDNDYRISILYQLIPYLMISCSEVMFSITGLQFSYSMAPEKMKSVILGAWCLTTAFGNFLTVAVESFHFFSNVAHDFLFYAALMAVDMILFAALGYYYNPYHSKKRQQQQSQKVSRSKSSEKNNQDNI